MQLLFAYDHRFYRSAQGDVHTSGAFPAWVWDRYLDHFGKVRVIARDGGPTPPGANLGRSDKPGVSFELMPSVGLREIVGPSEAKIRVRDAVRASGAVVARLSSEIGLMALREARTQGKPYAVEVVSCAWDGYMNNGSIVAKAYAPLIYRRMRRAIRKAPLALYVTSSWLQGRYPTSGHSGVASNVELLPFSSEAEANRERRLQDIAAGSLPVLGTVGTLKVKTKGIHIAIDALARLRASGVELTYRVLGPGPIEPWKAIAQRHGVADLVHFDGTRSVGEGVCGWLDEIDVYLQPSFQEGLPRATIEAMSRGAACIGSTCGGIPELLPPERLHPPGDVSRLTDLIRRVTSSAAAIRETSRADRHTVRDYDADVLKRRRHEFFGRLRVVAEQGSSSAAKASAN